MKSLLPPELQSQWNIRDTVPRRDRLRELAFAGYTIPRCGMFADMVRLGVPLVVYTDELAHCGEGKELWKPGDEVRWPKSQFCSEFIKGHDEHGREYTLSYSTRRLVIGDMVFFVDYQSEQSWMSNTDCTYKVRPLPRGKPNPAARSRDTLPYPMYAIDFVIDEDSDDIAVDLNVCPGVPVEVVNMVGRDVLQQSVAEFCRSRGLIA